MIVSTVGLNFHWQEDARTLPPSEALASQSLGDLGAQASVT